jgi:ferritin-like metal-binding protein YciE
MARTERSGHTTTDHDFIRRWVEERGGWPARVAGTESGGDDAGLIRVDFPGYSGEGSLERIEWEEWFQKFDESDLAFLHRDMSHGRGDLDRFNKLVKRGDDDNDNESRTSRGRSGGSRSGSGGSRSSSGGSSRGGSSRSSSGTSSRSGGNKSSGTSSRSGGSKSSGGSSRSSGSKSGGTAPSRSGDSKSSGSSSRATSSRSSSKSSSSKSSSRNGNGSSRSGGGAKSTARKVVAAVREMLPGGNGNGGGSEMRELLKHELGDLLFAEKVFLKATRTLAREAQDPAIRTRVEEHVRETEGQIERLNQAFRAIGEKPRAEKCQAALGLQAEHDSFKSEEKPSKTLLSAFDLGSGLRVEHYEIAAYRTAIAVATAVGERECAGILKENLKEEMAMASFLEKSSLGVLRTMARA